jgi:hypothetical protein
MSNPNMPNIPGMSAMSDTLEFMKNLWGGMGSAGMGIPGMVMPTLSVDEINKHITDLKAVESWLNMNMHMLRGTIQALEVQSATLSALQAMGQTLSSAVNPNAATGAASAFPFPHAATRAADDQQAEPGGEPKRQTRSEIKEEFKTAPKPAATSEPGSPSTPDAGNFAVPLANPAVWWNMLQDQFKQAVNTALPSETAAPAAKPAPVAARKRKARPKS